MDSLAIWPESPICEQDIRAFICRSAKEDSTSKTKEQQGFTKRMTSVNRMFLSNQIFITKTFLHAEATLAGYTKDLHRFNVTLFFIFAN